MHGIKINEKKLIFGNDGINKNNFHKHGQIDVDKRDLNKISISDEDSCGKKRYALSNE